MRADNADTDASYPDTDPAASKFECRLLNLNAYID